MAQQEATPNPEASTDGGAAAAVTGAGIEVPNGPGAPGWEPVPEGGASRAGFATGPPARIEEGALTPRSGLVALLLVLAWTFGCCALAVHGSVQPQQMLMVLGFGAILTVFLVQFPRLFVAAVVVIWGGSTGAALAVATPDDQARLAGGLWRSAPVMAALAGLAVWLHRRPLRRAELVVVYASVLIAIPWCIAMKSLLESGVANLFPSQQRSEPQLYAWARELPWWAPTVSPPSLPEKPQELLTLAPDDQRYLQADRRYQEQLAAHAQQAAEATERTSLAVKGFLQGNGGRVPWELWWRPLVYWTCMALAYEAMLMGLLLMFRKRWIEHERLPFVWSEPLLLFIRDKAAVNNRRGWVTFLAGLAICLPAIIWMGPAGESLTGWTMPPWASFQPGIQGGVDLTDLNVLPGVPLRLYWGPLVLAMFLLFPVDVLMTVALTYIVFRMVIPGIMNSMGLQVGPVRLGQFTGWGLRFGGCIGILFWSLWFNRRTIRGYLRSLWGGKPTNMESTDELPRWLVAGLAIAGLIAFVWLGTYAAKPTLRLPWGDGWVDLPFPVPIQMLCLTVIILIFAFAQARQRVEGNLLTYDNNYGSHMMVSVQRSMLKDHYTLAYTGVPVTGSSWATHWMQWGFNGQLKSLGPHNMLLEAFKVGYELKARARCIAKAIALTMLVVAVITPLLYVQLMYVYGFENSYQGGLNTWSSFTQWSERGASYGLHSTSSVFIQPANNFYDRYAVWFNGLYGVIFMGIIFYLRREFPRFPLSPVGVVLAAEVWPTAAGLPFSAEWVWFSFLVCWAVKSLIFRWLGVRYFREKIQPAVIMFICGMIFAMMVYIFRHVSLGQGSVK